jgi:hypothetical protein
MMLPRDGIVRTWVIENGGKITDFFCLYRIEHIYGGVKLNNACLLTFGLSGN